MRIGIDVCCWSNRRGFGRFTRELISALFRIDHDNEYFLFIDQHSAQCVDLPRGDKSTVVKVRTRQAPVDAASAQGRRSLLDIYAMSREVVRYPLDIFFFPAVYSYFPVFNRARIAVTFHDMIPDQFPEQIFADRKHRFFWQLKEFFALRQADLIVTVSEYSKQQIQRRYPKKKIRVVLEAPGPVFSEHPKLCSDFPFLRNGDAYLLHVGGISPHKNLQRLVYAYHRLIQNDDFNCVKLVFAGDYQQDSFYSDYRNLIGLIRQLGIEDLVVFTGYIHDEVLASLYRAASLVVLPSLQEGFGLPAIEAMACGTPVTASSAGSLPEILGDAGFLFDPYSVEQMTDALVAVLRDAGLRQSMKEKGLARAQNFSWDHAARHSLSIFAELTENKQ